VAAGCCATLPLGAQGLPKTAPSHVVVVVMENHAASQIFGAPDAPYINSLLPQSAVFTQSYAVAHPSEPNYLALFSGSTHRIDDDRCPIELRGANLAQQLLQAGKTFVAYSEGLPWAGFAGCNAPGGYARKHAPWANYPEVPAQLHQPMTAFPSTHLERLPTVAMVVLNLEDDMHDGTVAQGDAALKAQLDPYVQWCRTHDALLIVTWDEDDGRHANRIPTFFYGPMVRAGRYPSRITHYSVLRTLEALYGLAPIGEAARAATIEEIW
jgi:acid phosphatase